MNREEIFTSAFLQPNRRDKLLALLANPSRRRAFLGKALHSCDFVTEHCVEIPEERQTPDAIHDMLRDAGATETCFAISESEDLDGKECRLMDALGSIVGRGIGTILVCEPERLGYYEGNDMEERVILQRK